MLKFKTKLLQTISNARNLLNMLRALFKMRLPACPISVPTAYQFYVEDEEDVTLTGIGQLTFVPPKPQYPFGFLARYCWW